MRRAIAVSAAGLGGTSPNPPVGCVILDSAGHVIGEGYHERKGEAHAETQALRSAGELAVGATAVVTLEPCNHEGRTPPCRQALIDAQVRRVAIAMMDPTSRGEGGAAALRAAGVDVETGVLEDEARLVLGSWLAATTTRCPVITWPYVFSERGGAAEPADIPDALALRISMDAVVHADGSVTEAVPGSHGSGVLRLPILAPGDDAHLNASLLYDGGIRAVVLNGGLDVAGPFLDAELVSRIVAYLPDGKASRRPDVAASWQLLPPGFVIGRVTRLRGFVRVDADYGDRR
jgi:diaminohydroxyphosphoribosylaminopyrimidine deaminase / 5-amino-6-(5-phosphoribosylamino)uracil reductase